MEDKIFEQVLKVRETGLTNMFDLLGVQRVAFDMGLYDLVCYTGDKDNHKEYVNVIICGREETA
jgi:hypothetical protein